MANRTIEDFQRELPVLVLPTEVRAAVQTILDHAVRHPEQITIIEDRVDTYLHLGRSPDGFAELSLCLRLI
jgi:hypothetical protein